MLKELKVAEEAARSAGKILKRLFGHVRQITKKGDIDLVTEADIQAEKAILNIIRKHFPRDNILSEEAGVRGHASNRTWLIDPLDGTTNFVHGFPFFAVSIALEVDKQVVLGIVHNPFMDELFKALKGSGAFLNREILNVSRTRHLKEALLGTGFPYNIHKGAHKIMRLFEKMLITAQGIRRPGSAAIDMCYVAAGRLDGFWEQDLMPWDTAAGAVIVKEAGGILSTFQGNPYTAYRKSVVAANPFIHRAMIEVLNR